MDFPSDTAERTEDVAEAAGAAAETVTYVATPLDFDACLAAFREASKGWDQLPEDYTNEQSDAVAAVVEPARAALFACHATTGSQLLAKLKIATDQAMPREGEMASVMKDAERLLRRSGPAYGIMSGVNASLAFYGGEYSRQFAAAHGIDPGPDGGAGEGDLETNLRAVENFRATTSGDLLLKMRLLSVAYFGAKPPEHPGDWLEPAFLNGSMPPHVVKGLMDDVEELARKSIGRDHSIIVRDVADKVNQAASGVVCAALFGATLVRSVEALIDDRLRKMTTPTWALPDFAREAIKEIAEDASNLLNLAQDNFAAAKKAGEEIEDANLLARVKAVSE
jgi:hypothetical protein